MKGGKAGRKRRSAGGGTPRPAGSKDSSRRDGAPRPTDGPPKKGARKKPHYGGTSTASED